MEKMIKGFDELKEGMMNITKSNTGWSYEKQMSVIEHVVCNQKKTKIENFWECLKLKEPCFFMEQRTKKMLSIKNESSQKGYRSKNLFFFLVDTFERPEGVFLQFVYFSISEKEMAELQLNFPSKNNRVNFKNNLIKIKTIDICNKKSTEIKVHSNTSIRVSGSIAWDCSQPAGTYEAQSVEFCLRRIESKFGIAHSDSPWSILLMNFQTSEAQSAELQKKIDFKELKNLPELELLDSRNNKSKMSFRIVFNKQLQEQTGVDIIQFGRFRFSITTMGRILVHYSQKIRKNNDVKSIEEIRSVVKKMGEYVQKVIQPAQERTARILGFPLVVNVQ